ncbi:MAG: ScpA family protein [Pseudomonadota bacterium]
MTEPTLSIDALSENASEADGDEAFVVDVGGFEGPLHLLLELARKQKVDLLHVSVLDLANQYLAFIMEAKRQRIDLAADYLLMAAWLAYMKSKLLLPKPEKAEAEELSGDEMATRLAFRLKRLNAMRVAADELEAGPVLGNVVFLRGAPEQPRVIKKTEYNTTVFHLSSAFGAIRDRKHKEAPHRIEKQFVLPLEAARDGLRLVIPALEEWESLDNIRERLRPQTTDLPARSVTASVFSAALELARDGEVDLRQDDINFAPLFLRGMHGYTPGGAHEPA